MRDLLRNISFAFAVAAAIFTTPLLAQDKAQLWPVTAKNMTKRPVYFIARFSHWYTKHDTLQLKVEKADAGRYYRNNIRGALPANRRSKKILNLWFLSYPNSNVTSMQIIQFYLPRNKSLCNVAIITKTQGHMSRIISAIPNSSKCKVSWSKKWQKTNPKKAKTIRPISIVLR